MPSLRLGEAAGEFTDVTGADQLTHMRVPGRRQGPVIACCAATPDPPLRVPAPEPLELGIPVVPAVTGGHRGRWQAAALRVAADEAETAARARQLLLAAGSAMPAGRSPARRGSGGRVRRTAGCPAHRPAGQAQSRPDAPSPQVLLPGAAGRAGGPVAPRIAGPGRGESRAPQEQTFNHLSARHGGRVTRQPQRVCGQQRCASQPPCFTWLT